MGSGSKTITLSDARTLELTDDNLQTIENIMPALQSYYSIVQRDPCVHKLGAPRDTQPPDKAPNPKLYTESRKAVDLRKQWQPR